MIYLDHHATTPVDPRVLDAMLPYFSASFGNPSSRTHRFGWEAADAVERARKQVAAAIGASAREIVFTSGATEANCLAITGVAAAAPPERRHVVTVATEHKAVLDAVRPLERAGWRVSVLPVPRTGILDAGEVAEALTPETALVSVMLANNEIGVLQPVRSIAEAAHAHGALVHTDAVQALGRVPVNVRDLGVDLASFSAHKVYGPKGVGALFVRRGVERQLAAPMRGGGQERGLRGGTLNVPGIVGFGAASALAVQDLDADGARLAELGDRLWRRLAETIAGVWLNGAVTPRLPGSLNVTFDGIDGEGLLVALTEVAASSGAACTSAEPSHVLTALGLDRGRALASLRFGLGRATTAQDVDEAASHVADVVGYLRAAAPRGQLAAAGQER
ncbi:MAG: cysteine desulfurase family protein [Vicinamibacterales bacterium]